MNMSELPTVGSLLVARRPMQAWINDNERGQGGLRVAEGDTGLVLQVWRVNTRVRIRMLVNDVVVMFSHVQNCVWLNWHSASSTNSI
jgi:hypothetical protein